MRGGYLSSCNQISPLFWRSPTPWPVQMLLSPSGEGVVACIPGAQGCCAVNACLGSDVVADRASVVAGHRVAGAGLGLSL